MARLVIVLVASLLVGLITASAALSGRETVIHAEAPEQRQMAEWALSRYEAAGLELPPLIIEFPGRDLAGCDGVPARVYLNQVPILIRMCWNDAFIMLHELAHGWVFHSLPASKKASFMALRADVVSWASPDVSWAQRGNEHAANVIAWGLLDTPFPISNTYPNDPDSLRAAFGHLTGTTPLHDGGLGVQRPDREFFSAGRSNPRLESGR